jgi:hypothetical protein
MFNEVGELIAAIVVFAAVGLYVVWYALDRPSRT